MSPPPSTTIQGVNLLPAWRRQARRQRRHLRRWLLACSLYAAALTLTWLGAHWVWTGDERALAQTQSQLEADLKQVDESLAQLRPRLAQVQATLAASRSVGGKPDWSILLNLLAQWLGEDMMLTACQLEPLDAGSPVMPAVPAVPAAPVPPTGSPAASVASSASAPGRYRLRLQGLGRTQQAVSAYVLGLEQTGLFERVKLISTRKEPFGSGQAVGFELECQLRP
ncbi:MAG TPA: PilN domain-containing protein [Phycisphaeraceae bacterium]